jgi:hypothetical protein
LVFASRHAGDVDLDRAARHRQAQRIEIRGGRSMRMANHVRGGLATPAFCAALGTSSLADGLPRDLDEYVASGMEAWRIPGSRMPKKKAGTSHLRGTDGASWFSLPAP